MNWREYYIVGLILSCFFAGCAAPKEVVQEEEDFFALIPIVELSEDLIFSPENDMRARLPRNWIVMDAVQFEDPNIFAVACDSDYTMSIVFSKIPLTDDLRKEYHTKGMDGLLKYNYDERKELIWVESLMVGKPEIFALGQRKFGAYAFSTDSGATVTRVALYYTHKHLYECAITHLPFSEHDLPSNDILYEVHQIVLAGVEW